MRLRINFAEIKERALLKNQRARTIAQEEIVNRVESLGELTNAEKINLIFADQTLSTVERAIAVAKLRSTGEQVLIEFKGKNQWARV